jgi:hypothetical protein
MSVELYDGSKQYNPGDQCFVYNNNLMQPFEGVIKYVFVCVRYHEAYGYHFPSTPDMGSDFRWPNESGYQEWMKTQYWELVWPEWKAENKYTEYSIVKYKGNYYQATWRMIRHETGINQTTYQMEYEYRVLGNTAPPNELEDEDGVRVWATTPSRRKVSSFVTAPFSLDRPTPGYGYYWGDLQHYQHLDSQKLCRSPYDSNYDTHDWNAGTYSRQDGVSWEVYIDLPKYELSFYQGADYPPSPEPRPLKKVMFIDAGTTPAGRCGYAMQHWRIGTVGYKDVSFMVFVPEGEEDDGAGGFYWQGEASNPPDVGGVANPGIALYHARGYGYYTHNHPLFFKRKISINVASQQFTYSWTAVPVNYQGVPSTYYNRTTTSSVIQGASQFTPKGDCYSYTDWGMYSQPWLPDKNFIGGYQLPTGKDTSVSTPQVYTKVVDDND